MILDCSSCATRFTVHDDVFAAGPRRVRCVKCQHVWLVGDAVPIADTIPAVEASFAEVLADVPDDNVVVIEANAPSEGKIQKLLDLLAHLTITPRQAQVISLVLLAAILVLGVFGRHTLAARSPFLAHIFVMLGVQHESAANQFEIQLSRAEKCLLNGRDMLCIEGKVTHNGQEPLDVPPIRITALNIDGKIFTDADDKAILVWTVTTEKGKLLPGETRPFSLTVPYPEQAITDFDYGFTDDEHKPTH
jgi:predicted Zn finger-like uncharacterized protein